MKIALLECPYHSFKAISVEDESGGTRITPGKCCGCWNVVKEWTLTIGEGRRALDAIKDALILDERNS